MRPPWTEHRPTGHACGPPFGSVPCPPLPGTARPRWTAGAAHRGLAPPILKRAPRAQHKNPSASPSGDLKAAECAAGRWWGRERMGKVSPYPPRRQVGGFPRAVAVWSRSVAIRGPCARQDARQPRSWACAHPSPVAASLPLGGAAEGSSLIAPLDDTRRAGSADRAKS